MEAPTQSGIPTADAISRAGPGGGVGLLTIDLGAIADNYRRLCRQAAPTACAAVVKANAYGLGIDAVAPVLWQAGARTFFVALPDEALTLRALLSDARIGVLGGLLPGSAEAMAAGGIWPVLNHLGEVAAWGALADRRGSPPLPAFLHIDTDMNRLGLPPDEQSRLAADPGLLSGIDLRGILSHLACADDAGSPMTAAQAESFRKALTALPQAPSSLANSSGLFRKAASGFDLARPGMALYGLNPTPEQPNPMRPVVGLTVPILQVRHVDSPMTVGYGAKHKIAQAAKIITIPVGYADGLLRFLSNSGVVWLAGRPAPIVGRVSMDLVTADVTGIPEDLTAPGQPVELLGPNQDADALAHAAGTIGYEILTSLGTRYRRQYLPAASDIIGR